ncbi:hypothetical protein [Amycolatopsis suaedae]|uniref:Uncharacterized protein n=1 Tax=Amycolatopsis suaedae TaxID=2510978 RepID=A0A4Q7J4D1_9PSEU|nr:hypothetical protein [Amycolatopsis suaedae]RZQ61522.1 hypothetical protein EWH70_24480 [Amycolatopsis suaedae]
MNSKRPWIVAGATLALAGFGTAVAVAADSGPVHDSRPAPVVQQYDPAPQQAAAVDDSPESADSPAASVNDSADSPAAAPAPPSPDNTADSAATADSPN